MLGPQYERWRELCELIAKEQEPTRFTQLVEELLQELHKKQSRLKIGEAKGRAAD